MRFLVTCGPTYESLDEVRRLTNFSTGKLGIGLANHLHEAGHEVTLLKGYYAVCEVKPRVEPVVFTTTDDLLQRFRSAATTPFDAVFHAAAVSDFRFGQVFRRSSDGALEPLKSGKFGTREGTLLAELVPTAKVIAESRGLFPSTRIFGWKYEVDGNRQGTVMLGQKQIAENRSDFCVVNGPAYGVGFGIVNPAGFALHCDDRETLYPELLRLAGR
jgi:phosphopantothenoylcysteine synthetase/decarboxylase